MKKKFLTKKIKLNYFVDDSNIEKGIFKGGPILPHKFDDLHIQTYKDKLKFQLHIKGTKKSLEDLGKFLINIANYKTIDPAYHDHLGTDENISGNTEIIIHHPKSTWKST